MSKILVLFAHPALEKSRVNRHLAAAVRELPGVTFHDLYEAYPEFDIDMPAGAGPARRARRDRLAAPLLLVQHPGAAQGVAGSRAGTWVGLRLGRQDAAWQAGSQRRHHGGSGAGLFFRRTQPTQHAPVSGPDRADLSPLRCRVSAPLRRPWHPWNDPSRRSALTPTTIDACSRRFMKSGWTGRPFPSISASIGAWTTCCGSKGRESDVR